MPRFWVLFAAFISTALTSTAHSFPSTDIQFLVATGPLRNYRHSLEYCQNIGARLPTSQEAVDIYGLSLDPVDNTTRIANYDQEASTGSFWISETSRFNCPLYFEIEQQTQHGQTCESHKITRACSIAAHTTRIQTVCVIDRNLPKI
jgi:hypothetical protein